MQPTLNKNLKYRDIVLYKRLSDKQKVDLTPFEGQIVILRNPQNKSELLIKRLTGVDSEGCCWVTSDKGQRGFRDSNYFGPLPNDHVVGVARCVVFPQPRKI